MAWPFLGGNGLNVNLLFPGRQAREKPAENRSHTHPAPGILPQRFGHPTPNIQIPPHQQGLLAQLNSHCRELRRYSFSFALWVSHSRSLLNSARVVGKRGLTIRDRRITPAAIAARREITPQASALQPHPQWKSSVMR